MAPRGCALPLSPPFLRSRICMPVTRSALLPAMYGAAGSSRAPAAPGFPPRFNVNYLPVCLFFSFPPFLSSSATWACSPKEGVVQPGGKKGGGGGKKGNEKWQTDHLLARRLTAILLGRRARLLRRARPGERWRGRGGVAPGGAPWAAPAVRPAGRGAPGGMGPPCRARTAPHRTAPHRTRCCWHGAGASLDPRRPPAPGPLSTSGRFYALAATPRSSPRSASTRVTRRSSPSRLPGRSGAARGEPRAPAASPQRARTVPFVNRAPRPRTWSAFPAPSARSADDSDRDSPGSGRAGSAACPRDAPAPRDAHGAAERSIAAPRCGNLRGCGGYFIIHLKYF